MSSASRFEIVELKNGEIVLRRTDTEQQALVTIRFSDEAKGFLGGSVAEVGKAMIGTGVQLVGQIYEQSGGSTEDLENARVLH